MSEKPIDSRLPLEPAIPYQPPTVVPLGNVRDLLAGNAGTQPDGGDPDLPNRAEA